MNRAPRYPAGNVTCENCRYAEAAGSSALQCPYCWLRDGQGCHHGGPCEGCEADRPPRQVPLPGGDLSVQWDRWRVQHPAGTTEGLAMWVRPAGPDGAWTLEEFQTDHEGPSLERPDFLDLYGAEELARADAWAATW